jgi:uncharacterized membrane protein YdjX (TVP38/TMEM64 family)
MAAGARPRPPASAGVVRRAPRWLPVLLVGIALVLAWALGLGEYLSLDSIATNRASLKGFVAAHQLLALVAYILAYIVATVLLLPGVALLTVLGGFLFGWWVGGLATVVAATVGATLIFTIARSSFGDLLVKRGGGLVCRIMQGFEADAFSYLLFLRLVPLFPFFLVNVATALCRVRTRTFLLATLLGIVPGTFAYATLGSGLDSIIAAEAAAHDRCLVAASACAPGFTPANLLTPELVAAFLMLGAIALLPPLFKRLKRS